MAATKQFLLNYDSNILLPYTTIDCILGKEDDNPNEATITGIDLITDNLLKNMKEFIYNNSGNLIGNQIDGEKISNAYVLGISTLKDGEKQVFTKFHKLSLEHPEQHAGQYLGADGTSHEIKFNAGAKSQWYSTSINVEPSNDLDKPIAADVSININISNECFSIKQGQLYSEYSENAKNAVFSKFSKYTAMIGESDPSTGKEIPTNIGSYKALQLINGELSAIKKIGSNKKPIYIDENGVINEFNATIGKNTCPVYLNNGDLTACTANVGSDDKKTPIFLKNGVFTEFTNKVPVYKGDSIGSSDQPTYIDSSGFVQACNYSAATADSNRLIYASNGAIREQNGSAGNSKNPVYLENGQIKAIDISIGDSQTPVYFESGEIKPCSLKAKSIIDAPSADQYLMSDSKGQGVWGRGNTTTEGSFDNISNIPYYLVGIDPSDPSCYGDGSFKHLTGAKKSDGTGIYFKNYELFQTSDENLKTFTSEIDINFDNLATIKKGIYHWTDDPNKISDIGIGARSLEALYPEIVDENDGVKTIAYNRLGVIALAAIDKLHLRVKELEIEMKELKAEIRALKQGK